MTIDPSKIKMLISDVDGVWTDGTFYKGTDSELLSKGRRLADDFRGLDGLL